VDEIVDLGGADAPFGEECEAVGNATGGIVRQGGRLEARHLAGLPIEQAQVGKGPTNVDAEVVAPPGVLASRERRFSL
jgi:hypothetical protein